LHDDADDRSVEPVLGSWIQEFFPELEAWEPGTSVDLGISPGAAFSTFKTSLGGLVSSNF
jgi:hypothetical protein